MDKTAPQTRMFSRHQDPRPYVAIFCAIALGALLIALIAGGPTESGSGAIPGPARATDCPRGEPSGFPLSKVEGRTPQQVELWAQSIGMTLRTVVKDGEMLARTADYRTDRINVQVDSGVVTRYCGNF